MENSTRDYANLLHEFKKLKLLETATPLLSQWTKEELQKGYESHTGDSSGNTLLHYSCYNGCYDLSVKLIEEYGLNPQARNKRGMSALHMACGFHDNLKLVRYLVESCKCDPFQLNDDGRTAMHYAIAVRSRTIVQYFMKHCGCGSLNTIAASDIMTIALSYGNYDVIKWLISEAGGGCSLDVLKLLHDRVEDESLFSSIMSHCSNPNVQDEHGNTLLHEICLSPTSLSSNIFHALVSDLICNPIIENNEGDTPLHIICSSLAIKGYTNAKCRLLFVLLMSAKVSPDIRFKCGDISVLSVVCNAILQGHHDPSVLRYLAIDCDSDLSAGSDIITYTLCNILCTWGPEWLYLLLDIIKQYKPYIILENGKTVCVMCCPVKCCTLGSCECVSSSDCDICQSRHHPLHYCSMYSCLGQTTSTKCECTVFSKLFKIFQIHKCHMFESKNGLYLLFDFLFHCYTSVTCECDFHGLIFEMFKAIPPFSISEETQFQIIKKFGPYPATSFIDHTAMVASLCQINEDSSPTSLVDSNIYTLCQQNPLQAARTIICDIKPYSSNICSLFYYIITHCDLDLMRRVDEFDNTLLHLACMFYDGDSTLIEYLLSTGKVNPFCAPNYYQEVPLSLMFFHPGPLISDPLKMDKLIIKFGETEVSHPIELYVNIVILGYPGVGKSTLVKVVNERKDVLFRRFRSVSKSDVELCTAGIVPHILNDKDMGRIIVHDLAGQVEYYSSHTAVLENLLQGSAAVFVIVVSLANGELAINTLRFWMNVVDNVSHKALRQCRALIVTSYADIPGKSPLSKTLQSILDEYTSAESGRCSLSPVVYHDKIISLDCRRLGGAELTSFITVLSNSCKVLRNGVKEMSLYCHMLYELLTSSPVANSVFVLRDLIDQIKEKEDVYLPTDVTQLFGIIQSLSSTGLIVYLGKIAHPNKFWIIVNKSALLRELNGVLFAPIKFKQHDDMLASDTGIVKLSKLLHKFPKYDVEMLVYFLEYMHLSQEISAQFLSSSNLISASTAKTTALVQERYLFIPALIKTTNKPDSNEVELSFQFGWLLECTESWSILIPRFIHLLLLDVFAKYTEQGSSDPLNKICHIWNNGIYWKDRGGISTVLEVFDNNRYLVLLMSYKHNFVKNIISRRKDLIEDILLTKGRVLPKTPVNEYVIGNISGLQYPKVLENCCKHLSLYSIVQVAQCCLDGCELVVDRNNTTHASVSQLLNAEGSSDELFESVFAGRNPEDIVKGNLSLSKALSATSSSHEFKQDELPTLVDQPNSQSSTSSLVGTQYISSDAITSIAGHQQVKTSICTDSASQPNQQSLTMHQDNSTAINPYTGIITENTPRILDIISHPEKLSNELWSQGLLSRAMKRDVHTTTGISDYKKASMIMNEITCFFEQMGDSEEFLKFCDVLVKHGQPGLDRIANEMVSQFEKYCTKNLQVEDSNSSVNNGDSNTVNEADLESVKDGNAVPNETENIRESNTMNEIKSSRDGNAVPNETESVRDHGNTMSETENSRDGNTVPNETESDRNSKTVNETESSRDGNAVPNETESVRNSNTVNEIESNRDGAVPNETKC